MLTRPLIAFDIETVPDPDFGRRIMGLEGDNAAVIEAMTSRRLEETEGRTQYPSPPLHLVSWNGNGNGRGDRKPATVAIPLGIGIRQP